MNRNKQHGITFLELLIVVVIIGILAAFAYPSYMRYVADTKRTAATSILLQIADRQQQSFMDNKTYAADLVDLGFPANPLVVGDDGRPLTSSDTQSVYSVALSNVGVTTYTITATPLHAQQALDTECGTMTLNQAGAKGSAGPVEDCWR
jgi:type IV pilus assembly protein PilE